MAKSKKDDVTSDGLISKAFGNAKSDIAQIDQFIMDLLSEAQSRSSDLKHHEVAMQMSKLYEVRQKSNEQIIKLASLVQKSELSSPDEGEIDYDSLMEQLEEESEEVVFKK